MSPYKFFRKTQFATNLSDLILKQLPQRFDEFKWNIFRESPYIVMTLDGN